MTVRMRRAVDFLYSLPRFTTKNSPDHTRKLMGLLGDPCLDRRVIHVAGSNGKGSVCCFLYHMLLCAGCSAAMFTSPHLVDIRERFQMDGGMVGEAEFLRAYDLVKAAAGELFKNTGNYPTFFEFIFAMAMVIFEKSQAEYIILETGLGGRLDATNCYPRPILSVITSISAEHTEILGDTLPQIAAEKAGILKEGVPVVFLARGCAGALSAFRTEAERQETLSARPDEQEELEAAEVIRRRAEQLGCPYRVLSYDAGNAAFERRRMPVSGVSREAVYKLFHICEIKENGIDFSISTAYDRANDGERAESLAERGQTAARASADNRIWHITGRAVWQAEDAALAVESMRMLRVMPDDVIRQGLLAAEWPGRMQEALPGIWFDGAHNPAGIRAFLDTVREMVKTDEERPLLLFSMVREKDIRTAVTLLNTGVSWDCVAVAAVPGGRGVPAETLKQMFLQSADRQTEGREKAAGSPTGCPVEAFASPEEALSAMRARKKTRQKIFCTGSLYFIGALSEAAERTERAGGSPAEDRSACAMECTVSCES